MHCGSPMGSDACQVSPKYQKDVLHCYQVAKLAVNKNPIGPFYIWAIEGLPSKFFSQKGFPFPNIANGLFSRWSQQVSIWHLRLLYMKQQEKPVIILVHRK